MAGFRIHTVAPDLTLRPSEFFRPVSDLLSGFDCNTTVKCEVVSKLIRELILSYFQQLEFHIMYEMLSGFRVDVPLYVKCAWSQTNDTHTLNSWSLQYDQILHKNR